jgi:hypothetical protein
VPFGENHMDEIYESCNIQMIHEDDNTTDLEVQEEATWFEDEFNYES